MEDSIGPGELMLGVGDDDGGGVLRGGELGEERHDLSAPGVVEGGCGFVGEHDGGTAHEGPGDGDALAFATGELSGPVVEAVAEPHGVEQLVGLVSVVVGDLAVEVGDEPELLDGGEGGQEVRALEHEADVVPPAGGASPVGSMGEVLSGDDHKDAPEGELVNAVRAVAAGHQPLDPRVAARVVARSHRNPDTPTARELEVLTAVAEGCDNATIAHRLYISQATVKTHLASVFNKLGVTTRTGAVAEARRRGHLR